MNQHKLPFATKQPNIINSLAAALAEIRDAKLYQPEYKTFEEYSKKRWQ